MSKQTVLILSPEQANAIRDQSHLLDPRPLTNGSYALPIRVVDDPTHKELREILTDLQKREVDDADWLQPRDNEGAN